MEEIYKKYSLLIYHYLYGLTNDVELSEELMQETFYSAIKGINKFKGDSTISVWLYQIAKNKWKDYLRKNNKKKIISLNENFDNLEFEEELKEELQIKSETIDLYRAIHKLDKEVRELFNLRLKGELSFKEISEIMGKTEEWVRVTFYRGKLKLKEELLKDEKRM